MKTIFPKTTHGIVHRATETNFRYQAWGTVARDENGTLYTVASGFRAGHVCPFGKTVLYISKNEGKTWTPPIVINDTYMDDRDAGILYMGNGRMLVSWFTHSAHAYNTLWRDDIQLHAGPEVRDAALGMINGYDYLPDSEKVAGSYIRVSEDYGVTWSETICLPISAPHGPTMCRDGSLIYLGVQYYEEDWIHTKNGVIDNASLYRSTDGGYTWKLESKIKAPAWFTEKHSLCEPHVLEMPNGNLLGAFRIEGVSPFTIALSISEDGGKTWGEMYPTGISGSPPHLMMHSSGALVCSFARREFPCGERAMVSYDFGKTWEDEYVLHNPKDERLWDLGYPSTVELDDGSLMTVYYQRYEDDTKCSMLYTKWNLEK
ncbi:MAG: exo-alpha-sialidase [Ruminococcaceae bacterium]|nr:exo-alpha-sialidase [Oscillospiraceae bacterium]